MKNSSAEWTPIKLLPKHHNPDRIFLNQFRVQLAPAWDRNSIRVQHWYAQNQLVYIVIVFLFPVQNHPNLGPKIYVWKSHIKLDFIWPWGWVLCKDETIGFLKNIVLYNDSEDGT